VAVLTILDLRNLARKDAAANDTTTKPAAIRWVVFLSGLCVPSLPLLLCLMGEEARVDFVCIDSILPCVLDDDSLDLGLFCK
jgi:hypothetical protein